MQVKASVYGTNGKRNMFTSSAHKFSRYGSSLDQVHKKYAFVPLYKVAQIGFTPFATDAIFTT